MRDKNGVHKWGTIFDKYEQSIPIGNWYAESNDSVRRP